MLWEIHTFGGGDWLRMIFNAVAMVFGNGDYTVAMRTVTLATFTGIMVKVAFSKDGAANFRYIMALIFFIYVALIPKVKIAITDNIVPANSAVVANVPLGVAAVAGTFSTIGWWLTKTMETTLSLPLAQPTKTGFMFHSALMNAVDKVAITDNRTAENYQKFFQSCVVIDGIGHNRFTWDEITQSPDIDAFFKSRVVAGVAGFFYTNSSSVKSFQFCKAGYSLVSADIKQNVPQAIKGIAMPWVAEFGSIDNAANMLNGKIAPTIQQLTGARGSKDQIVQQYMIKNEMDSAIAGLSGEVGDEATQRYILEKANAERTLSFKAVGKVAAEKMPLLRIIIEGVLYAISPLILLLALTNPWPVSVAYAKAILWINLWAPMYAVLDFSRAYFDKAHLQSISVAYNSVGVALSPNTISQVNSYLSEASNISGYLMGGLPVICWLLVSNSGAMLASFAARTGDGFEKSVDKGVGEVVKGEGGSFGNNWNQEHNNAAMQNQSDGGSAHATSGITHSAKTSTGALVTATSSGNVGVTQLSSNFAASANTAQSFNQTAQSQYTQTKAKEEATSTALTDNTAALLNKMQSTSHKLSTDTSDSHTDKTGTQKSIEKANAIMERSVDDYAKAHNFSKETTAALKVNVGLPKAAGVLSPVTGGGSVGTSAATREQQNVTRGFVATKEGQTAIREAASVMVEDMKSTKGSMGDDSVKGLSSALNNQKTASDAHTLAVKDSETAAKTATIAEQNAKNMTVDRAGAMLNYAVNTLHYAPEQYDKMMIGVRDNNAESVREYQAILAATGFSAPTNSIDNDYKTNANTVTTDGAKELKEQGSANKAVIAAANHQHNAKVDKSDKVPKNTGQGAKPVPSAEITPVSPTFGQGNKDLTGLTPDKNSVVGETVELAGSGVFNAVTGLSKSVVNVMTGQPIAPDPLDGNRPKK